MKFKLLVGTLIVSASMCSQSFGFDLLGRMLGANYHGGGCCEPSCCDTGYTGCGHDYGCGCDSCCGNTHGGLFGGFKGRHHGGCNSCNSCDPCACQPVYTGCDSCGYDAGCGCGGGYDSCNSCDPCNSCCKRRFSLFGWLFGGHHRRGHGCGCNSCGYDSGCGCGSSYGPTDLPGADGGEPAPVPPAPVADPSASARYPMYIRPASRIIRN